MRMIFKDQFIHGVRGPKALKGKESSEDLHPGNVMVKLGAQQLTCLDPYQLEAITAVKASIYIIYTYI